MAGLLYLQRPPFQSHSKRCKPKARHWYRLSRHLLSSRVIDPIGKRVRELWLYQATLSDNWTVSVWEFYILTLTLLSFVDLEIYTDFRVKHPRTVTGRIIASAYHIARSSPLPASHSLKHVISLRFQFDVCNSGRAFLIFALRSCGVLFRVLPTLI
jgi:hypothetical protein